MPKIIKNTLAGGELSTDLDGRTDLSKYATGVQLMSNFYPTRFGGASNRPGMEYVGRVKPASYTDTFNTKLIPFQFSVEQTYVLEFTSRTVDWFSKFNSSTLESVWGTQTGTWTLGDGVATCSTDVASSNTLVTDTQTAVSTFKFSGTMSSSNFPVGSATDVYNNVQKIDLGAFYVAFSNGSNFSGPNYRGYEIYNAGSGTTYIDSDDFSNIRWSLSYSFGVYVLNFNGTNYTFSPASGAVSPTITLSNVISGTGAPDNTATFSAIQKDLYKRDAYRQADNVMRVVKDGSIVLTSRRNSTYKWTASGSGTSEYYCELTAGGNPSIPGATEVWENSSQMTEGTLGSLSAGEWAWGDNDTLGYGTIYVRLTDSADPDSKAADYVESDYQLDTGIKDYSLDNLSYAQSKDVLFIAQESLSPAKITRTADDAWTYATLTFAPVASAPTDFYASNTGFAANDKPQFYKIANLDEDLNESLPTSEIRVDTDLTWPTAGRVDLYWNNISDGLESTPVFQWTASASGTAEYYCELNGGGDPSLPTDISTMWEDQTEMTEGTLGSLAIGEWAYGDNDTLGYNTIYVRIAAGADPDTKAVGYLLYKRTSDNQYRVYKNLRGDWGWLGDMDNPWYLDESDNEPDISVAPKNDDDPFNTGDADDYPSCVAIFQQRLVYGRSRNNPQRVWMSTSGDLTNFAKSQPLSSEDPIVVTLVSGGRVDEIRHFLPLRQDLLTLTNGSEYTLSSQSGEGAVGPFNVQFKKQGYEGVSRTIPPIGIANKGIFVERNNTDMRQIEYIDANSGYPSQDLNLLTKHLFENKTIVDWCYQQSPSSIVWMVMSDGTAVSMTYLPEQDLIAFARHSTDGFIKACESITTDGDDEVYFVVARTATTAPASQSWFIEKLASREFGDNVRDAKFLDSMLSYNPTKTITNVAITATEITVTSVDHGYSNGDFVLIDNVVGISATGSNSEYTQFNDRYYKVASVVSNKTFELEDLDGVALTSTDFSGTYLSGGNCWKCTNSVSGLGHLEGDTVTVLADGQAIGTFTVTSGAITLGTTDPGYGVVHVGLPYNCDIQTLRLDIPSNVETMQYVKKNIRKVIMRFKDTVSGYAGPDSDNLTLIKWRQYEEWQQPNALKTEDVEHKMKSTWDRDGRIYFRQSDPYPTTILAFIMEVDVGDM